MDFIKENGELDLAKVDARNYTDFHGLFIEEMDPHLARLMLNDTTTIDHPVMETIQNEVNQSIIRPKLDADGKPVVITFPRFSEESKSLLKTRIDRLDHEGRYNIYYSQRSRRGKKVGRFYSNDNLGLTCLARNMRNTIYQYKNWIDLDFRASHPSLYIQIGKKLRVPTPKLKEWVQDKTPIVKMLSEYHTPKGCTPLLKDHIKKLVNSAIYGGGIVTWAEELQSGDLKKNKRPVAISHASNNTDGHPWYHELKKELKTLCDKLVQVNQALIQRVQKPDVSDPWKHEGTMISYYLGILENECLYHAYQFGVQRNLIQPRKCNLAYDGFTIPPPPPHINIQEELHLITTTFSRKLA